MRLFSFKKNYFIVAINFTVKKPLKNAREAVVLALPFTSKLKK